MKLRLNTQKFKQLRQTNGWSQHQLSEMSRTSLRTIQRMEIEGSYSMESLKSVAAVFEIDFNELLLEAEGNEVDKKKVTHFSFNVEFKKIWLQNKAIFWTMNLAQAFLTGLVFSWLVSGDIERLSLIVGFIVMEVLLWSLFGGYSAAKNRFIQKYGDLYSQK